ncbi:MAG: glycosyltransferase family 2 protein [Candidatus Marinimicrobia bacterium]|nr:glycosyltransferase family 2 protein [Candidatus Neomarinimicrobiota bacterium]
MEISLSVIIATKDRFEDIKTCIASIINQTLFPQTLIVVDASEKNGLDKIINDQLKGIDLEFFYIHSKPGLTHQRNLGILNNQKDYILFLDDDVVLDKNYIREMLLTINHAGHDVGGLTGLITNATQLGLFSSFVRKIFFLPENGKGEIKKSGANNNYFKLSEITEIQWLSGSNQFYKSAVFQYELFDENLKGYGYMEDVDFSFRISRYFKLLYNPKARCIHHQKTSKETRTAIREKQKLFMKNYHYLFKKNRQQTKINILCHYWSCLGLLLRGIFFERNLGFILGTIEGISENLYNQNELINPKIHDSQR